MNHEIINRNGLKIAIRVDGDKTESGKLAFVAHGMKGTMDQPHIEAFTRSFVTNDFRVVRFDATHSVGQSDGRFEDVTYDSYVSDLEDVISWARTQSWFTTPFALCGHSMGAQSTSWYAEHHPHEVSLLLPMAPTVNFELHTATMTPAYLEKWQRNGHKTFTSTKYPGKKFQIPWLYEESLKRFDILPKANRLTMPVLIVVGSRDSPCPPHHQKIFMDHIASDDKSLKVVEGLEHSYRDHHTNEVGMGLEEVESIVTEWIRTTDQAHRSRA